MSNNIEELESAVMRRLNELQREYEIRAKPYIDQLVRINTLRTQPKFFVFSDKPVESVCSKCGIRLSPVMGYVCGDPECPTFPKVS